MTLVYLSTFIIVFYNFFLLKVNTNDAVDCVCFSSEMMESRPMIEQVLKSYAIQHKRVKKQPPSGRDFFSAVPFVHYMCLSL